MGIHGAAAALAGDGAGEQIARDRPGHLAVDVVAGRNAEPQGRERHGAEIAFLLVGPQFLERPLGRFGGKTCEMSGRFGHLSPLDGETGAGDERVAAGDLAQLSRRSRGGMGHVGTLLRARELQPRFGPVGTELGHKPPRMDRGEPLLGIAECARGELRHLPIRRADGEIGLRRLAERFPVAGTPGQARLPALDFQRVRIERARMFDEIAARRQIVRGIGVLGALQDLSDAGR